MTLLIFLAILFAALAMGVPIAFSLLLGGIGLMFWLGMSDPQVVAFTLINGLDAYPLLAIPFFLIAGEVMNSGGISRRIVNLAIALVGHTRGGLGYVAVLVGIMLAALSGSAIADAAALSAFLVPLMIRDGYSPGRSAGLVATAGIIGPVIPPSMAFILFGILSQTSITKLFLAGVVPGILMGAALAVTWSIVVRSEKREPRPRATWSETRSAFIDSLWALGLPVIIIVGLKFGFVTPTEAGVLAAVYALFVTMVVYRELSFTRMTEVVTKAMITGSTVMLIVGCAMLVSWMIAVSGMNQTILEVFAPLVDRPKLLVAAICLLVLAMGMVIDMAPILLILTPLVMPLIEKAGVEPTYFGVVFIIAGVIGLITPPVGTVLAVVTSVTRADYADVARGVLPFLASQLLVLSILILWPEIVTVPAELLFKR